MIVDTDENSSVSVGSREVAVIDKGSNQGASAGQVVRVMKPGLKVTGSKAIPFDAMAAEKKANASLMTR